METNMQTSPIEQHYIFFTESRVGIHSFETREKIEQIVGTFIPYYNKEKKNFWYTGSIVDKALFYSYRAEEKESVKPIFLIGYDLDENGEFMASVLRDVLVFHGISRKKIYRMPLAENGYMGITDFINIDRYKKFKKIDNLFQEELLTNKLPKIGILKALGLYYLNKNRNKKVEISNKGTSTATILFNNIRKGRE